MARRGIRSLWLVADYAKNAVHIEEGTEKRMKLRVLKPMISYV